MFAVPDFKFQVIGYFHLRKRRILHNKRIKFVVDCISVLTQIRLLACVSRPFTSRDDGDGRKLARSVSQDGWLWIGKRMEGRFDRMQTYDRGSACLANLL